MSAGVPHDTQHDGMTEATCRERYGACPHVQPYGGVPHDTLTEIRERVNAGQDISDDDVRVLLAELTILAAELARVSRELELEREKRAFSQALVEDYRTDKALNPAASRKRGRLWVSTG